MKQIKKISSFALALAFLLSLSVIAFADDLTNGEVGGFAPDHVDDPQTLAKSVNIQKAIVAYNPDEAYVYGPAITYTYSITAAADEELVDITDQPADHESGIATTVTVLPGVMAPSLTGTAENTIAWTNNDILNASSTGTANIKNLVVDFSGITFTKPGVYRYKINETTTYENTGVTDGTSTAIRYLDVYVMRSSSYTDGTAPGQWAIYGYVCFDSTLGTNNVTPESHKTNGFVGGSDTQGNTTADQYYTYNFTVTKDLVGDNTMINHQFPLTVSFSNGPTGTFQLIAKTDGTNSSLTTTKVNAGADTVNYATGITGATTGYIKYIGIPNTTVVTVTEENDNVGTTYTATVKEDDTKDDGSALVSVPVTSTTGLLASESLAASIDNTETATRTAAYAGEAGSLAKNVQIQFTNTLAIISPTGVVFRIAPYVIMLVVGLLIFFAMRRYRRREEA